MSVQVWEGNGIEYHSNNDADIVSVRVCIEKLCCAFLWRNGFNSSETADRFNTLISDIRLGINSNEKLGVTVLPRLRIFCCINITENVGDMVNEEYKQVMEKLINHLEKMSQ